MTHPSNKTKQTVANGFTLIELLVVVAILALLMSILLPSLATARDGARSCVCSSNIRQLAIANQCYATANKGYYVRAAEDMSAFGGGVKRWHGQRKSALSSDPDETRFKPGLGPLARYLGDDGAVKECPIFRNFNEDLGAFERGCGGYGYNSQYIGGRYDAYKSSKADEHSAKSSQVDHPANTVMFTDAASIKINPLELQPYFIEYSFCEPPFMVQEDGSLNSAYLTPSIHFRHNKKTNVAWADGHVAQQRMSFTYEGTNIYNVSEQVFRAQHVGWFGPKDNSLFDLN